MSILAPERHQSETIGLIPNRWNRKRIARKLGRNIDAVVIANSGRMMKEMIKGLACSQNGIRLVPRSFARRIIHATALKRGDTNVTDPTGSLNPITPTICTWYGRNIEELSKEELIEAVKLLGREVERAHERHMVTLQRCKRYRERSV